MKEAIYSFSRNNDTNLAASMAFYTALSLVPALFLMTYVAGSLIGSSQKAFFRIQELINQFIPQYSETVMKEVRKVIGFKKGIGILNIIILLWSIVPLSSSIRSSLRTVFRIETTKPYLVEKLFDILIIILFIAGISLVAARSFLIDLMRSFVPFFQFPLYTGPFISVVIIFFLFFFLYGAFTFKGWRPVWSFSSIRSLFGLLDTAQEFRAKIKYLLAGAFVATGLWFLAKPIFNLMLVYNPGYGVTFGSFKSLFIVFIWIYYSQIIFLFGAEVASALQRKEALILKYVIASSRGLSERVRDRYVISVRAGEMVFNEGETAERMFYILKGKISIEKSGRQIAVLDEGNYIGEMSFFLNRPRSASARALEHTELLVIDYTNIDSLASEMPQLMKEILRQMASRLERGSLVA